jgi:hypothetical protein
VFLKINLHLRLEMCQTFLGFTNIESFADYQVPGANFSPAV